MQKYLTIAALIALVGASAHATCTVQYACGTGATGTAPTGTSVSSGTTFTPAANTCSKENSVFSHYLATVSDYTKAQDGVAKPGVTYTIPFNGSNTCSGNITVTLTPQWVAASGTPVVSAKSYTDSELLTRQANFAASATDKLILFSGSTNGAVGERAVVTSLGTPNSTSGLYSGTDLSSTEVPINSAVNTGVNRKQATVNGTANYVAMYDSNAHMTGGSKGIYNASSLTDLDTLVEADTLNSAIVDAVNSELIQVGLDGQPSSSGVLWKLNTVGNLSLLGAAASGGYDMSLLTTPGGDYCNKSLDAEDMYSDGCNSTTYNNLSYGDWAIPFTVNNETVYVTGTSACSSVGGTAGEVSENQSTIDDEYASQRSAAPTSSPAGKYCHCKVTGVDGNNVVSRWVFGYSYSSSSICAVRCANLCSNNVRYYSGFRSGVFGAVQQ